jgi:hypothetical protein
VADSAGVSNLNPTPPRPADPLGATFPGLGSIATTIHRLVQEGLTIDEAAEKVARWVDPSILPALQTLASVLQAVDRFLPGSEAPSE